MAQQKNGVGGKNGMGSRTRYGCVALLDRDSPTVVPLVTKGSSVNFCWVPWEVLMMLPHAVCYTFSSRQRFTSLCLLMVHVCGLCTRLHGNGVEIVFDGGAVCC